VLKRISQRHISLIFTVWAAAKIAAQQRPRSIWRIAALCCMVMTISPLLHFASLSREAHRMEAS
jgi:hypothetical protein